MQKKLLSANGASHAYVTYIFHRINFIKKGQCSFLNMYIFTLTGEENNGFRYYVFHIFGDWIDVQLDCIRSLNGNLTSIHSQEEYDFIKQLLKP